jgi:hypothetical protein
VSLPLFYALYCLEAGLFFTIVPWTRVWTLNSWLHSSVGLAAWADNPFFRGFISGIGVVHLILGVRELMRIAEQRRKESMQQ